MQDRICAEERLLTSTRKSVFFYRDSQVGCTPISVKREKNIIATSIFRISYQCFLTQEKSVGSIQALEDSFIYCLDKSDYDRLLNESTEWYKLGKYIADTLFINKCRKETAMLTDDAYNRYKLLLKTYPNIEQHVSQYHIASYLGIRAESLSRIKSLNIGQ